ncbi:MAG: bifunctional hydroxymethylpyrimidine kinase/phosphomethylpyrimidine kinase [Verrucomicrobiota bacterium]|jgi:hydroxymethylpyrimidine kinase/phosphomethylpyrimidine kinase|nr:bifunctional hydroxymethylpyrimidine kinase/phosphomethylpyrimidine kinase [Verrucomicrobiota bacterium]
MSSPDKIPVALTIAGSDSGGGAGIQADLRTFAALGVHGTNVVSTITAQNPKEVVALEPVQPAMILKQLEAVFSAFTPKAAKTGMLLTVRTVECVADFFEQKRRFPLVIDPVMISSSGSILLQTSALKALQARLLPLAGLVMPNVPEAEKLTGLDIRQPEDLRVAARMLYETYGCVALVKGGHLPRINESVDVLFDGKGEWLLAAPRSKGNSLPGTGCVYSAAIAAELANGKRLPEAVRQAKEYISKAIASPRQAGRLRIL